MASPRNVDFESQIPAELLIARIMRIHASISDLDSLRPSTQVNSLFTHLVKLCTLLSTIDTTALPQLRCKKCEKASSIYAAVPKAYLSLNLRHS